jgi:3-hydroxyacyl-[acyl-carrier-protein] dehydratase
MPHDFSPSNERLNRILIDAKMQCNMNLAAEPSLPLPCVDAIVELAENRVRCAREVKPQEEYFVDHFPGFSVLPGVLQLEGLVQAASWWIRNRENFSRSQIRMTACAQAKFVRLVRPHTHIDLEVDVLEAGDGRYRFKGQVLEKGEVAASARFTPRFSSLESDLNIKYRCLFDQISVSQNRKSS